MAIGATRSGGAAGAFVRAYGAAPNPSPGAVPSPSPGTAPTPPVTSASHADGSTSARAVPTPGTPSPTAAPMPPATSEPAGPTRHHSLLGKAYDTVRDRAGDASSVLSIAGAASLFLPKDGGPVARGLIVASLVAGGVDTVIQGSRWIGHRPGSSFGTTAYAATGLLPAASIFGLTALTHRPNIKEAYLLATVGANLALIGYEVGYRGPRIANHDENASGYLSFAAAVSGVIVRAKH